MEARFGKLLLSQDLGGVLEGSGEGFWGGEGLMDGLRLGSEDSRLGSEDLWPTGAP